MSGKKMISLLFLSAACCLPGAEPMIKVVETPRKNLLVNPEFGKPFSKNRIPRGWFFDNCSRKPGFEYNFGIPGEFYLYTSGRLFGYLAQENIPVTEGKTYYAAVEVRATTTVLMWIRTRDWKDGLDAQNHPRSNTELFSLQNPDQGESLVRELRHFVDPTILNPVGPERWTVCEAEFTVPKGHNVKQYSFRVGSIGGPEGWLRARRPVLKTAERNLSVRLDGRGLQRAELLHGNGVVLRHWKLEPAKESQELKFLLSSFMEKYSLKIIDQKGNTYGRTL